MRYSRRYLLRHGAFGLAAWAATSWKLRADAQVTPPSGDLGDYALFLQNEAAGTAGAAAQSAPKELVVTADNILGPYYRPGAPYRAKITPPLAPGKVLVIRGRVWGIDTRRPLAGATLDIWQADVNGRYDNDDPRNPPAPGVFKYRARLITDEQGVYEYETIHPGRYKNGNTYRPSHIHYMIRCPGYKTLVTQLYFAGDPMNDSDRFVKPSLIIEPQAITTPHGEYREGVFDIVLAAAE